MKKKKKTIVTENGIVWKFRHDSTPFAKQVVSLLKMVKPEKPRRINGSNNLT